MMKQILHLINQINYNKTTHFLAATSISPASFILDSFSPKDQSIIGGMWNGVPIEEQKEMDWVK